MRMNERPEVRVGDTDREAAVERLRVALNEGRLNLHEYDERLTRAYQSVTYGDLAELFADLPQSGGTLATQRPATVRTPATEPVYPSPGLVADIPTWIKVIWAVWLTVVGINLTIWILVSLSNGELTYFWPMWVAGPWGATLVWLSLGGVAIRRSRRAASIRRSLEVARRGSGGKAKKSKKYR
jgi:hypothetical protein